MLPTIMMIGCINRGQRSSAIQLHQRILINANTVHDGVPHVSKDKFYNKMNIITILLTAITAL